MKLNFRFVIFVFCLGAFAITAYSNSFSWTAPQGTIWFYEDDEESPDEVIITKIENPVDNDNLIIPATLCERPVSGLRGGYLGYSPYQCSVLGGANNENIKKITLSEGIKKTRSCGILQLRCSNRNTTP